MTVTARPGLAALNEIPLSPMSQSRLDLVSADMRSVGPWPDRKKSEARQLLALEQLAGSSRMQVTSLDIEQDLRAAIWLDVPVAMAPSPDGSLNVVRGAVIGLVYPQVILSTALPGFALVCLVEPAAGAFYPNVGASRGQRMCLGAILPVGIPVSELVLLSYGLLTGQTIMLDTSDSAGVMNVEAAQYWSANQAKMPLSSTPFLRLNR
jgi:hypothetical protein